MFYCNECAEKNGYPETLSKSEGKCELCGKHALCNDRPSSLLGGSKVMYDATLAMKITKTGCEIIRNFQQKLKTKQYPIIDVPADGKPKWYGGARCMAFVYSKHHGNFILRGFTDEVEKYLKKHYTHYFYYFSMWSDGRSRGHWKFWKERVYIFEPRRSRRRADRRDKYTVHKSGNGGVYNDFADLKKEKEVNLIFKRLPKRWIPEFDTL